MKRSGAILIMLAMFGLCASLAFGNPAMLPKHPGYPIGNPVDPVNNQALANDPGQTNLFGEKALVEAARFHDAEAQQQLPPNVNDARLLEKIPGALPKVQGPDIRIEPPVKEATRVP